MEITPELITQLARLSRIGLVEGEEHRLMLDLTQIVTYMEQLAALNVEDQQPLRSVIQEQSCPLCSDEVEGSQLLSRDRFLANSPSHVAGMIRVPAILQGYES